MSVDVYTCAVTERIEASFGKFTSTLGALVDILPFPSGGGGGGTVEVDLTELIASTDLIGENIDTLTCQVLEGQKLAAGAYKEIAGLNENIHNMADRLAELEGVRT